MTDHDPAVERALEVARRELAVEVPPGHAAAVARAALAAAPAPRPWWEIAWPAAWRAALAVNLVAASLLAWALLRAPAAAPPGAAVDLTDPLDAEATGMLSRALGLDEGGAP